MKHSVLEGSNFTFTRLIIGTNNCIQYSCIIHKSSIIIFFIRYLRHYYLIINKYIPKISHKIKYMFIERQVVILKNKCNNKIINHLHINIIQMFKVPSSPLTKPSHITPRMRSMSNYQPSKKTIEEIIISKPDPKNNKNQSLFTRSNIIHQYVKQTLQKMLKIKQIESLSNEEYLRQNNIYAQRYIQASRQYFSQVNPQNILTQEQHNKNQEEVLHQVSKKSSNKQPLTYQRKIGKIKSTEINKKHNQRQQQYRKSQQQYKFNKIVHKNTNELINPNSQGFKYYIKQPDKDHQSIKLRMQKIFSNQNFLLQPCQIKTLKLQKRPFTATDQYKQEFSTKIHSKLNYHNPQKEYHSTFRKSNGFMSNNSQRKNSYENTYNYLSEMRVIRLRNQKEKSTFKFQPHIEQNIQPWNLDTQKDH